MLLKYPVKVSYDESGEIVSIRVPDLNRDVFHDIHQSYESCSDNKPFNLYWRPILKTLINDSITRDIQQDKFINPPKKIKDYYKDEDIHFCHWEKISIDVKLKKGFFEKHLRNIGMFINFVSVVTTMAIQILATEITTKDKESGRRIGIPLASAAFAMNIITYNYSGALRVLDSSGRGTDRLIYNIFSKRNQNTINMQLPPDHIISHSIWNRLTKMSILFVITSLFLTWVISTSIGTFQEAIATGHKAESYEPVLTDFIVSALAWIQTSSSGIAMVTFYLPFIINAIKHGFNKLDDYCDNHHPIKATHINVNDEDIDDRTHLLASTV